MKKTKIRLLAAVLSLCLLAGCAGTAASHATATPEPSPATASTPAPEQPAPSAAPDPVSLEE